VNLVAEKDKKAWLPTPVYDEFRYEEEAQASKGFY
jgi:hypothetical protein